MSKPSESFDETNEKFIDIIQANGFDREFPEIEINEIDISGFVVLPIPIDVLELWKDLLGGNGIDNID